MLQDLAWEIILLHIFQISNLLLSDFIFIFIVIMAIEFKDNGNPLIALLISGVRRLTYNISAMYKLDTNF